MSTKSSRFTSAGSIPTSASSSAAACFIKLVARLSASCTISSVGLTAPSPTSVRSTVGSTVSSSPVTGSPVLSVSALITSVGTVVGTLGSPAPAINPVVGSLGVTSVGAAVAGASSVVWNSGRLRYSSIFAAAPSAGLPDAYASSTRLTSAASSGLDISLPAKGPSSFRILAVGPIPNCLPKVFNAFLSLPIAVLGAVGGVTAASVVAGAADGGMPVNKSP